MKFNFKKLAELSEANKDNPVYIKTLQTMVNLVLYPLKDPMGWNNLSSHNVAVESLKELGIVEQSGDKTPEKLNS